MARGRQMGRLKLKRLSEETRNAYLYEWKAKDLVENPRDFPKLTSPAIFGNQASLKVEIGPGTGEYLCDLAARHPETNFLGVEPRDGPYRMRWAGQAKRASKIYASST